jgi:hypothetical protein
LIKLADPAAVPGLIAMLFRLDDENNPAIAEALTGFTGAAVGSAWFDWMVSGSKPTPISPPTAGKGSRLCTRRGSVHCGGCQACAGGDRKLGDHPNRVARPRRPDIAWAGYFSDAL